jgi:hypothetical protein
MCGRSNFEGRRMSTITAKNRTRYEGPPPGENLYLRRVSIARRDCRAICFFMVFTLSGSFSRYLQAADRASAKRYILKSYPGANFLR